MDLIWSANTPVQGLFTFLSYFGCVIRIYYLQAPASRFVKVQSGLDLAHSTHLSKFTPKLEQTILMAA